MQRRGTASLAADVLRDKITMGEMEPGSRIVVDKLSQNLGVSANTLREALQLLEREHLVVQYLNRGIFVSRLEKADIVDLYTMRRLLELSVLRNTKTVPADALAAMRRAVQRADEALAEKNWAACSGATVAFHSALVSMAGSERAMVTMSRLMAELRLTLSMLHEHLELRTPLLEQRRQLTELLAHGKLAEAEEVLSDYLDSGERAVLALHDQLYGD